jgi:hypothetical protein
VILAPLGIRTVMSVAAPLPSEVKRR